MRFWGIAATALVVGCHPAVLGRATVIESLKDEDARLLSKLGETRVSLDFENAPLPGVLDYIRELTGINFIIENGLGLAKDAIEIRVRDATVEEVLRRILPPLGQAFCVEGGVVVIASRERIARRADDARSRRKP